ncbi:MAG: hypothetical protein CMF65_04120 [Magnetovibrio sp.]|nr:hypothetical protein [Magnetovibrio sp.]|tara:strand:- start:1617 stop:1991 length:375 start_codon:yes stop_codon:yes gene_type:complete
MGNSISFLSLDKIISKFGWEKRLVLLIADNEDIRLISGVDSFFKKGECQNKIRNLELYKIIGDEIKRYKIPERYEGRRGIWLIGYDGGDKAYSRDLSLLNQLYKIIDKMPIRQNEMLHQDSRCD